MRYSCIKNWIVIGVFFSLSSVCFAEKKSKDELIIKNIKQFNQAEPYEQFPAGAATHNKVLNSDAFSFPSNNMSFERQLLFSVGNRLFTRNWVSSSSQSSEGIGPLFNARSCQSCHFKDGRGHLPSSNEDDSVSLILKLLNSNSFNGDSVYGNQFQEFSIQNIKPEGKIKVEYTYSKVKLADGTQVELRKPNFSLTRHIQEMIKKS